MESDVVYMPTTEFVYNNKEDQNKNIGTYWQYCNKPNGDLTNGVPIELVGSGNEDVEWGCSHVNVTI